MNARRQTLTTEIGTQVRALRHQRSFTQDKLAERSDLSVDAIRRIERGAFTPSVCTMAQICEGLDLSLKTFFDSFGRGRSTQVAQLCDLLSTRSSTEIRAICRVVHAMID